jgi:hypothetical protein
MGMDLDMSRAPAREEEDAATIEVDRLDPADLLPLSPGIANLVGPLEVRRQGGERLDASMQTQASEALRTGTVTATACPAAFLHGPVRWLLPLGLLAFLTLGLAAWVLLAHP